ncbi:hypothetical protein ACFFLM_02830 [Deinococcus oregonensis]|uniref:Uncharacterized protein n=1 Tax=Deinococcus oregonensis TaxID=1805970 RepID=A0ABV6ATT4_9DEIO
MTHNSNDQDTDMIGISAERADQVEATDESGASSGAGALPNGMENPGVNATDENNGRASKPQGTAGEAANQGSANRASEDPAVREQG